MGLEQGFTFPQDPCQGRGQELVIEVGVEGLTPVLEGEGIALQDDAGLTRATYSGLSARDAATASLQAGLSARDEAIEIRVKTAGARWPLIIDPIVATPLATLTMDGATGKLGDAVATDGSTVLVGAPGVGLGEAVWVGAAYTFVRAGAGWTFEARLVADNRAKNDYFGDSVALAGDVALVGAPGKEVGGNARQGAAYLDLIRKGSGSDHTSLHFARSG